MCDRQADLTAGPGKERERRDEKEILEISEYHSRR